MTRVVIGAVGVVATAYGASLLLARGFADAAAAAAWLGGGVVVHDAILAPLALVVGAGLMRVTPARWRAAVAGALVVLGSLTLLAIPVLGRFGARPDNPTLLDRNYLLGWAAVSAVVVLGALLVGGLAGSPWHSRRRRRPRDGTGAGGR